MKNYIIAATLLAATLSGAAAEAQAPLKDFVRDNRRTLHISFGQRNLVLEAPANMCFLDESDPAQEGVVDGLKAAAAKRVQGQVVAVFTDCYAIAGLSSINLDNPAGMTDTGLVVWKNPSIGETTDMNRADYLDRREVSLPMEVAAALTALPTAKIDRNAARTQNAALVAYVAPTTIDYQKYTISGVVASTLVENVPLDFSMTRIMPKDASFKEELQDLMTVFVNQQVTLNEKN